MPTTAPTDLPNLQSWISSSPPYHTCNHVRTPFIDVNDFTTHELEAALCYAIQVYEGEQSDLRTRVEDARDTAPADVLAHAHQILDWTTSGPMSQIPPRDFQQLAIAAKFADDLTYQNCVVGLAVGIKKLKDEIATLQQVGKTTTEGDEDDWFLVGRAEAEQREQERLYAEIEIQLDGALAKRVEKVEEGEIEVMYERPWE